jgi:mannose-6-phosphate isomerase
MTPLSRLPHRVAVNCPPVYYAGGSRIAAFRRLERAAAGPEDWVGSTAALPSGLLAGTDPTTGVSRLEGGELLRDAVRDDAPGWLGPVLAGSLRAGEVGLLVKLLDAGERLPVHCHPSRAAARSLLGSPFGKTEGWAVLHADPGATVWLGFRRDVGRDELHALVAAQDGKAMLELMNEIEVGAGDVIYVPAGAPHAIGRGVFLTELQEPTSFSVLAEYEAFGLDATQATLGLGWEQALGCFDLRGAGGGDPRSLVRRPERISSGDGGVVDRLFPVHADEYFRGFRLGVAGSLTFEPAGYRVLVATSGAAQLQFERGPSAQVGEGETWVLPFALGALHAEGSAELVVAMPPASFDAS